MTPSVSVFTALDCMVILRYILVPNHFGPNFSPEIPDWQFFIQSKLHSTNSCFNLSTMATFSCPQHRHCREVQLYVGNINRVCSCLE